MSFRRRVASSALLLGVGACALSVSGTHWAASHGFPRRMHKAPSGNLIARLRGQTLPDGIVKVERTP